MPQTHLTTSDTTVPAWVEGQGPAVVLLHGSADSPAAWQPVAALLAERWQVTAPALPPITSGLALDRDLPWLDEVMTATGARALAGHSYGALLALRWALAHPGRLDHLLLAEPIAWGIAREVPGMAARLGELGRLCIDRFAAGKAAEATAWLVDYWNGAGFWARLPPKIHAALIAGSPRTFAEVSCGGADGTNAAELASLGVPTHLLAGANTTAESLMVSRLLAAAIPGAQLTVLEGAGHQFLRSHPAIVAAALG